MNDSQKTRTQLLDELAELRRRVATLEGEQRSSMESATPEGQLRLSTLLSNLPGMAYRCKNDGNWTMEFVSEGSLALTGFAPQAFVGNQQLAYANIIHPNDRQMVWDRVQEAVVGRRHFQMEYRIRTASGQEKWIWEQGIAIYSESGEVDALEGLMTDITERKSAEAALKKAHDVLEDKVRERTAELTAANERLQLEIEDRQRTAEALQQSCNELQTIYDGMTDGMHILDLETLKPVRVNAALCRMMGYSQEEALRLTFADAHPSEDLPEILEKFQSRVAGGTAAPDEIRMVRKDGSMFHVEATGSRIIYNGRSCMLCFFHDITERKQAEELIRQNEVKYQSLIDACPDAVVMSDLTGKVLFASRETWNLLGLPEDVDLLGVNVFDYVIEHNKHRLEESIPTLIELGVRRHTEYVARRGDGTTIPTEVSSAVIFDAKNEPKSVMAVIRDIGERKRADEALQREHRTLKHLLQSSDHERQVIAYEIHDGLAQQLAGAIMQLETYAYQKDHKPKEAVKAFNAATTMLRQAHYEARRLISGVRPPILDESGVVTAIAHLVNERRAAKGPTIEFRSKVEFDRLAPIVENAIYRIVQEGLANACQHSESKRVRVELVQHDDWLRIKIQDWGIGFAPADVAENRFGLAGIRERARLLGGQTLVESEPKRGTSLTIELPLVVRE